VTSGIIAFVIGMVSTTLVLWFLFRTSLISFRKVKDLIVGAEYHLVVRHSYGVREYRCEYGSGPDGWLVFLRHYPDGRKTNTFVWNGVRNALHRQHEKEERKKLCEHWEEERGEE